MRTKDNLWNTLSAELKPHLGGDLEGQDSRSGLGANEICEIELGLYLLTRVAPQMPAKSLWVLLTGYPFAAPEYLRMSKEQRQQVGVARHILLHFKSPRRWEQALEQYRKLNERVRLYDVDENLVSHSQRSISLCHRRNEVYAQILSRPLPYAARKISWADAGDYICSDGRKKAAVTIPGSFPLPQPPSGYHLEERRAHPPLKVPWSALLATARWMDRQTRRRGLPERNWLQTMRRIRFYMSPDEKSAFEHTEEIIFDQSMHVVGMVSAGKSTLMDVLAVWCALKGLHITLVVGDVLAVLERVQLFLQLGLKAAPIIGVSNRSKHRHRLHRVLTSERAMHPLLHQHVGFDYTSTACLLDGLRRGKKPFQLDPQPCLGLHTVSRNDGGEEEQPTDEPNANGKELACPFYSVCPYHQGQLELVDAAIWVATPASLVYTHVAPQIHRERLRFLEMVYRRSDLVVVDEVDRVQVQLDELFGPCLTLVDKGQDAWLGGLFARVSEKLNLEGMAQFSQPETRSWVKHLHDAQGAVHSLYNLLLKEPELSSWVDEIRDYFSGLSLLEKLTIEVCGIAKQEDTSPFDDPRFKAFWEPFATFLDDPLGAQSDHSLADLARQVMAVEDGQVRKRLQQWLQQQPHVAVSDEMLPHYALRLEFAIMLEVLSDCLNTLLREWKQVEAILGLEGGNAALFQSPPDDYAALLPDAPMGNILGFQYLRRAGDPKEPGELRFFRCLGVGRWLLLHLHDFLAADGLAGPHALLLSGTSWAGTSPTYHLQLPVTGILLAPHDEVAEINKSVFSYAFQRDQQRMPIEISGKYGQARIDALEEMLHAMAREQHVGAIRIPSLLEKKRDELPAGRQRILLLVGSYDEAKQAYRYLIRLHPDWENQAAYLVPDDSEFTSEWRGRDNRLHRGLVARLAESGAWLLIAPLLAVERGHNILNEEKKAAIGAAYFLIRPHPRPDDIHYIMHSINFWAINTYSDKGLLATLCENPQPDLESVGKKFRVAAFGEWRRLLRTPLRYGTLRHADREALTWSQLVSMWQVIGRLVRGGCAAQVFFCDAKFAPHTANLEPGDRENTSLIIGMLGVLRPYFDCSSEQTPREKDLVRILYGPLYQALEHMERGHFDA
jgi:pPIWI RE three-gene island domain Z